MTESNDSIQWKIDDRKFHSERAKTYDRDQKASGEIFKKHHDLPFIDKLKENKLEPVLDFGCGTGVFTIELAKRKIPTIAFDHSRDMVKIARDKVKNAGYDVSEFIIADCEYLPFKNQSFRGAVCNEVLHHLPDYEKAIKELLRTTKKGGVLYFAEPEAKVPWISKVLNKVGSSIWVMRGASLSPVTSIKTRERSLSGDEINGFLQSQGLKTRIRYSSLFPALPFLGSGLRYYLAQLISPIRITAKGNIFFIECEKT
jgi:ubiquinone/menaquinone biosynthesis C-methylase UbiE